ncbi:PaaI family thioesterase [Motilibacter deserti]|uniref:Hotdog fold thioesterase n=1 Tax=Motilibacter deserti TaxID=2714956 RepID=A0ABX0GN17_9ACTN|nr:hotdog fold thioesterase [Motilibacter deserti]NHC12214.1 hotdog fold thioesterase [Motilibacter deserti]
MDPHRVPGPGAPSFPPSALTERMGIVVTEASAQLVRGTMPVEGNTQPFGVLHGGASAVLAETLASVGATLHAGPGRAGAGIEINASHHRPGLSGTITGVATAVHLGRTLATYDVVLTDEESRRVCSARVTCALRDLR